MNLNLLLLWLKILIKENLGFEEVRVFVVIEI